MMPVMTIRYYAPSLQMASAMQVVLPERDNLPLRSAHVLLGPEGSDSSWWLRHARLEVLASTYGVVFLMPAVLEGCGFDMAFGYRFGQSLCQDLFVELEHDLPSLALRPETTWVVGLGLSGLGALHAALTRPDRFCGAACLGAVPDIAAYRNGKASSSYLTPARLKCLWGQREDGAPSVPDTVDLLTKRAREGASLRFYLGGCADEPETKAFCAACSSGIPCHVQNLGLETPIQEPEIYLEDFLNFSVPPMD